MVKGLTIFFCFHSLVLVPLSCLYLTKQNVVLCWTECFLAYVKEVEASKLLQGWHSVVVFGNNDVCIEYSSHIHLMPKSEAVKSCTCTLKPGTRIFSPLMSVYETTPHYLLFV